MKKQNKKQKGAILITTLWIVTILAALCVSTAHRSAITLKLSSYKIDKIKSRLSARAGILRALAMKRYEYDNKRSHTIDALNQPWANSPEIFKKKAFEEGFYTLSYIMHDERGAKDSSKRGLTLYGLSDEACRLNINTASAQMLTILITSFGVDEDTARETAYCILDWRDEDSSIGVDKFQKMLGAEDEYYQGLDNPYPCKNSKFEIAEELLLVKGISHELFYGKERKNSTSIGLKDFITVYTEGEVNINTASEKVLSALFGVDFDQVPVKIAAYRRGQDGIVGTKDDRWFSIGPYEIERGEEGMAQVKDLNDGSWLGNIFGIDTREYAQIKKLVQGVDGNKIAASSNIYRVAAMGEFEKVLSHIEAVYEFDSEKDVPIIKYWHQE